MKIITWNCQMAFRKKASFILEHSPDILVIPECEHPDKLKQNSQLQEATSVLWFGENLNKGLGVFSFGGYKLKLEKTHNPNYKIILPIKIVKDKERFNLLAIWANNPGDKDGAYITQIWKALPYYQSLLKKRNTFLVGDFNSNAIWDKKYSNHGHSHLVAYLTERKILSTYHSYKDQSPGDEKDPTWYMYRHEDKPYHLDYCFASLDWIKLLEKVEIGKYQDWSMHSDHMPVSATFNSELRFPII